MGHGVVDALGHLVLIQIGNGAVQRRSADEGVDARGFRRTNSLPAAVDIFEIRPRQSADGRGLRQLGNLGHGGKVTLAGNRKPGLDDVHAHFVQQDRDLHLFGMGHRRAGALFAVAQSGVKDQHMGLSGLVGHVGHPWECVLAGVRVLITSERSHPGGRSEAAKKQQTAKRCHRAGCPGCAGNDADLCHGRDYTFENPKGKPVFCGTAQNIPQGDGGVFRYIARGSPVAFTRSSPFARPRRVSTILGYEVIFCLRNAQKPCGGHSFVRTWRHRVFIRSTNSHQQRGPNERPYPFRQRCDSLVCAEQRRHRQSRR